MMIISVSGIYSTAYFHFFSLPLSFDAFYFFNILGHLFLSKTMISVYACNVRDGPSEVMLAFS